MTQAYLHKAKYDISGLLNGYEVNNVAVQKKKQRNFTVVKYDKNKCLPSQYTSVGFLRSMLFNNETNKIVCVGPNKSISVEEIMRYSSCVEGEADSIQYEEFVDGVMINVFWDETAKTWEYMTRSSVGANIRFYVEPHRNMTFRKMFEEALQECSINLDVLPKCYCYSFVLQHPCNRIVAPVESPRVVLVESHFISDAIVTLYPHGNSDDEKDLRRIIDTNSIPIPEKYSYTTVKEATDSHATRNIDFSCVGVVLKNYNSGWRAKIRNPVYEDVKHLRGNCPKKQFLYLTLRHSGNVTKYLKYYKEDSDEFLNYCKQLHSFTHNLYVNYVDCFINKKAHINTYPHQYKVCMTALHTIYLDRLMPRGKHVHKGIVINFFNEMPPQRQMYLLNYNFRK